MHGPARAMLTAQSEAQHWWTTALIPRPAIGRRAGWSRGTCRGRRCSRQLDECIVQSDNCQRGDHLSAGRENARNSKSQTV